MGMLSPLHYLFNVFIDHYNGSLQPSSFQSNPSQHFCSCLCIFFCTLIFFAVFLWTLLPVSWLMDASTGRNHQENQSQARGLRGKTGEHIAWEVTLTKRYLWIQWLATKCAWLPDTLNAAGEGKAQNFQLDLNLLKLKDTHIHAHTYKCMHIGTYTHIHAHTRMHAHTHIHAYTHTH